MQEEIEQKSFNLMISTTKLSARTVLRAVKAAIRLYQSKASQGKQSVRTLLRQNRGVSSVEISKTGIRGLERYAKKYGIDYAIRKDTAEVPPRYLVFFKAPDIRQSISPKIAETGASATLTVGTQIRLVIFWTGRNISVIPCWANPSVRTSRQSNAEPQRRKN